MAALSTVVLTRAQESSEVAVKIRGRAILDMPIIWTGSQAPDDAHSQDLWDALKAFDNGPKTGVEAVESFIQTHPDSVWVPSLEGNLAEYYRDAGRYTLALERWQAAWAATKDSQDVNSRQIAGRTVARWSRLLGSLGRKEFLATLFAEASQRGFDHSTYATAIQSSREGYLTMNSRPDLAYRCGSFALAYVIKTINPGNSAAKKISEASSPEGGFSMADLVKLGEEQKLHFVAAKRPDGAQEIVVPSVVHWKLDHYAAIISREGTRFKVMDPTFGQARLLDAETINAEASGNFLVAADNLPAAWKVLSEDEALSIRGKGFPDDIDDSDDEPPAPDDDPCDPPPNPPESNDGACVWDDPSATNCPSCGMTTWRVSEPYISLWLDDTPFYYRDSKTWMQLKLSYNQRGEAPKDDRFSSFGDRWECNWLTYVQADSNSPSATEFVAGGGQRSYTPDGVAVEYKSGNTMFYDAASGATYASPVRVNNFDQRRQYEYALMLANSKTNFFLTQQLDRYGRTRYFNYETLTNTSTVRVTNITDFDGKIITFNYTNPAYPQIITSVSNAYGAVAYFFYETNSQDSRLRLTNITDTAGISSSFTYDDTGLITNLHTPYGNTSFKSFAPTTVIGGNGGSGLNRAVEITEPGGLKQLYTYRDDGYDTNSADVSGYYYSQDSNFMNRNSYHWNRQQYSALSASALTNYLDMPKADYLKASLKHWRHKEPLDPSTGKLKVSGTLGDQAGPSLDGSGYRVEAVNYAYYGESNSVFVGTVAWVTNVTRHLGTGSATKSVNTARNAQGRPTIITHLSQNGVLTTFTNEYDLDGKRLLRQWGPNGELVRGYGYAATNSYLLTSVTNALGDFSLYTHDTNTLFVTSISTSSGLLTTNIYYNSGPYSNFLQASIDVGLRTNTYTYTNGNIYVHTNELGLATTNTWDALNRLILVAYPDGTTVSNGYSNLDLVEIKDRMNGRKKFVYNGLRQLTYATNENGAGVQFQYCDCGSLSSITRFLGARSLVTHLEHDLAGQLTNVVFPDNYSLTNFYDVSGLLTNRTDSSGRTVWFSYNEYSTLKEMGMGDKLFLHRDFDEYNRVFKSIDQDAVAVTNSFDLLGRVLERRALGNSHLAGLEHFVYDSRGLTNYTDPLGNLTSFVRDQTGRVLRQTNANNEALLFTYNAADQLLSLTDGNTNTTHWNYDEYGRVTNKVDAASNVVFKYIYDPNGQLTNRWTPAKSNVTYRYDLVGNLTNVSYLVSSNIALQYDDLNRLTNMVDGLGSTAFSWTDGNQLASEDGPWANDTVSYTYNNRLRSGLSISASTASPWTQSYGYDEFYRLTNITSPAGVFGTEYASIFSTIIGQSMIGDLVSQLDLPSGAYIQNSQDTLGRLTSTALTQPDTTVINLHNYLYNEGHQRTNQTFSMGNYMDYTYDPIGQLKTASGKEYGGSPLRAHEQFGYAYDHGWNLSYRTNNGMVQTFNANNLNELTGISRSGSNITVAGFTTTAATNVTVGGGTAILYGDATFARTNVTANDGVNTFTAVATDSDNRSASYTVAMNLPASQDYTYDQNGNLRTNKSFITFRTYDYDDENQLIRITQPGEWKSEFDYDGLMRRRVRREYAWQGSNWLLTDQVHYIYDGRLVVQERDGSNLLQVTYTRGNDLSGTLQGAGGIGGLLARTDNRLLAIGDSGASAYYHADAGGNISCMLNASNQIVARYSYDPFGYLIAAQGPLADANLYRFSSKEFHVNSGLIYYLYRFYDPSLQRWLNADPIRESGGWNLHAYISNTPMGGIDPFGLVLVIDPSATPGFKNRIKDCLNNLINRSQLGLQLVNEAINNPKRITITPDKEGAGSDGTVIPNSKNYPSNRPITISMHPKTPNGVAPDDYREVKKSYPQELIPNDRDGCAIALAHELGHVLYDYSESKNVPNIENPVRRDFGLQPRLTYRGTPVP